MKCRLGDLREGRCSYGFFYNQVACCSGIDRTSLPFEFLVTVVHLNDCSAGEVCHDWMSWSTYLGIRSIFGSSLLQAFVYVALAVSYFSRLQEYQY